MIRFSLLFSFFLGQMRFAMLCCLMGCVVSVFALTDVHAARAARQTEGTQAPKRHLMMFVRHAEKDLSVKGDNPPLNQAGRERAQMLAKTIEKILKEERAEPLNAIYVTEFDRTQQTAKPTSETTSIPFTHMKASDVASIVKELRKNPHSCLVVGHSNTIPDIITQLTGETVPPIEDDEYNNLYVLVIEGRRKYIDFKTYGMPPPRKRLTIPKQ